MRALRVSLAALAVLLLVGAGGGTALYVSKAGDFMSGALRFNTSTSQAYPVQLGAVAGTSKALAFQCSNATTCSAYLSYTPASGNGLLAGVTNLYSNGGFIIQTTGSSFQNSATGATPAFVASGTGPAMVAAGDTAANVDTNVGLTKSLHFETDLEKWVAGTGARTVQLGGGRNWAIERRSLTINPFMENSAQCPRCTECLGTTISAMDGQTCTDAAAATTSIIETVDFRNFITAAAAGSVSSWTSRAAETRRDKRPQMVWRGYVSATTTERVWYGLSSVALNGSATPVGHIAAWRYDTGAGDTTWTYCTGDGVTTSCAASAVTVQAGRVYTLGVDCAPSAACVFTVQDQINGAVTSFSKTTNLPTSATNMSPRHYCEALAAAARTCGVGPSVLETR